MNANLSARLKHLESKLPASKPHRRVFRIIAREHELADKTAMARQAGYEPERDMLIVRRIVAPDFPNVQLR